MPDDLEAAILAIEAEEFGLEVPKPKAKKQRKPRIKWRLPQVDNYHAHTQRDTVRAVRIDICELSIWFSYRTCIAFQVPGHPIVCRENDWSVTTGRHMSSLPGWVTKEHRVSAETFEKLWNRMAVPVLAGRPPRPLIKAVVPRKPKAPPPPPPPKIPTLTESMEFKRKLVREEAHV